MSNTSPKDQAIIAAAQITAAVIAKGAVTPTPAEAVQSYLEVLDGIVEGLDQRKDEPKYQMLFMG